MQDFMTHLADQVWPKGKRYGKSWEKKVSITDFPCVVFCYSAQVNENSKKESCHAKDGNPFGPFWSYFNIDFDGDIFYQPLFFDVTTEDAWTRK